MTYYDYLCALLEPMRIYRTERGSISGGELYAAGQALDGAQEKVDYAEREETGLKAEHMEKLSHIVTTPGFCTEKIGLYLATGLSQHEDHPDEDEFLRVTRIPLKEAVQRVMSGEFQDAKTALGLLMAWGMLGMGALPQGGHVSLE